MAIEKVTDANYEEFRNFSRAVLVVSTSWCKECGRYDPIIETLSRQMPFIRFGKVVLDKKIISNEDRSSQLKRDYRDINRWTLPTTLLFRNQREVPNSRINGFRPYSDIFPKIQKNLLLESLVFVPNGSIYVPALVKHIRNTRGPYVLELTRDSSLGRKGERIELEEKKFQWSA